MTTTFADTQGHALGLSAPSAGTAHRSQWAMVTAGLFAGLLLIGALIVTVAPMVDLKVSQAPVAGSTALSDYRAGEIGAGSSAISSAEAVRAFRASEIGAGSAAISSAEAVRAFRAGEIGAGSSAISSAEALRAFRASEIALGSVPAPSSTVRFAKAHHMPAQLTTATSPLADQGYRDQRLGEIGAGSGGASGTSPERSHGK